MAIVVDASVAVGWIVLTQATPLTRAALAYVGGNEGWVPSNFAIEVARALRNQERRGQLTPDKVSAGIALLQAQAIKQDQTNAVARIDTVFGLARRYTLRVADASYLELAIRLTLPLATKDAALARATGFVGIELFNP